MNDALKSKIADATKKNAAGGNQDASQAIGGSTCGISEDLTNTFLDLAQKGGDALKSIQAAVDPSKASTDSELFLKEEYEHAKRQRENADLKYYVAEENYYVNIKGSDAYKNLINDRIKSTGNKEYDQILKKFIDMNETASILITTADVRETAEENMNKVIDDLEKNNDDLINIINNGSGDTITYQRKSSYESKMKTMVENWSVIPIVIYWTLLILWILIVMIYLKQITMVNFAILVALILYPYLSTTIIVWVMGIIQSVWNFIFSAVKNRVSA